MSAESLTPERDDLWAKHDGLTPRCCAQMIALAGKLEQERNEARRIAAGHRDAAKAQEIVCPYHTWNLPWEDAAEALDSENSPIHPPR